MRNVPMENKRSHKSSRIPRPVIIFFAKALGLFVAWKLLYLLWLMPAGVPDRQLTRFVGHGTVDVLNFFSGGQVFHAVNAFQTQRLDGGEVSGDVVDIFWKGQNTLRVANACNGLELMVLYAGFLFCYPGTARRRYIFLGWGLLLICVLNILRCALLVWIFLRYRAYLDFSHHFLFTFLVYACIFLLWWRYTKNGVRHSISGAVSY